MFRVVSEPAALFHGLIIWFVCYFICLCMFLRLNLPYTYEELQRKVDSLLMQS
jgi:hypothetical protein